MKTPLLLTLYLPLLPLETLRRSWSDSGDYSIMDRDQVLVASTGAVDAGVRVGMRLGGVATIAPGAVMLDRGLEKEARSLDAIAMLQFTPGSLLLWISVCCSMLWRACGCSAGRWRYAAGFVTQSGVLVLLVGSVPPQRQKVRGCWRMQKAVVIARIADA